MKKLIKPIILILACSSCAKVPAPDVQEIHAVLDAWHKAAADADFDAYFSHFENDSSIFMGTDATERWTVGEFRPWSKPYFDRGKAWSFKANERYVYFSNKGSIAWFDEVLDTPNLGPSRGTGILTKTSNGWKISHYNLTVPIPNEIVGNVVKQIDSVLHH